MFDLGEPLAQLFGEGKSGQTWKSETEEGLSDVPVAAGTGRPHLRAGCGRGPRQPSCGGSRGRAGSGRPRPSAPLPPAAAFRAFFRPRRLLASEAERRGRLRPSKSRSVSCGRPSPLPPFFSSLDLLTPEEGREIVEGRRGGNLSPRLRPKSSTELLGADGPG